MSQRSSMKLILSLVALAVFAVIAMASGSTDAGPMQPATQLSVDTPMSDESEPAPAGAVAGEEPNLVCNEERCDERCGAQGCEIGACDPNHGICRCFLCD